MPDEAGGSPLLNPGHRLRKKILAYRRKDVHQNYFLFEHSRAVPGARGEVKHIAGLGNALLVADRKEHVATLDEGQLFVRMIVRRGNHVRRKTKAADHHSFANNHLPLDAFLELFDRDAGPVGVLWLQFFGSLHWMVHL
jgi:hypothetical protein